MKYRIILVFMIFSGCTNNDTCNDSNFKSKTFYDHLLEYQNKYPFPSNNSNEEMGLNKLEAGLKYIYEVAFFIHEEDTLMSITLSPEGLFEAKKYLYGVYQNRCLKPTYVYDEANISANFIRHNNIGLKNYTHDGGSGIDILFPIYYYKVNGNELKYLKADSIKTD